MAEKNIVHEIEAEKFITALALELKKIPEFEQPEWSYLVKTSASKERPPENPNWWFIRAASILRSLYINGVVGVARLRIKYGSRKDRGMQPERFQKASGKMLRLMLQQAEKAGFVEKTKSKKAGRKLNKKGKEMLEQVATSLKK